MKLTMRLTLDGLVRALRSKAHGLAEARDNRYRGAHRPAKGQPAAPKRRRATSSRKEGR